LQKNGGRENKLKNLCDLCGEKDLVVRMGNYDRIFICGYL
jgi:hypothetical protein